MTETIPPHGGVLVDLVLPKAEADRAVDEAEHLPKVEVGERELSDLEMLAVGALSPLQGFVGEKDYWSILREMHLTNGLPWTIPVTLWSAYIQLRPYGYEATLNWPWYAM